MSVTPDTAMVLAAGLGTRMRPLTNDRPKPLIEVCGRALIDHMLDRLREAGVQRVVVNVHYRADQMEAHVRARSDLDIIISDERGKLMETGGGVRQALALLGDRPIYVCNTDALWQERAPNALRALAVGFDASQMGARLMLVDRRETLGFDGPGDFHHDRDGRIRLRGEDLNAPFAYTGVQIVDPTLLRDEPIEPFSFMRVWRRLLDQRRVFGMALDGFWMHVGDPEAVRLAEARCAASTA
jgi:MurNAc alpha-1-phosphate uridylyltransferase